MAQRFPIVLCLVGSSYALLACSGVEDGRAAAGGAAGRPVDDAAPAGAGGASTGSAGGSGGAANGGTANGGAAGSAGGFAEDAGRDAADAAIVDAPSSDAPRADAATADGPRADGAVDAGPPRHRLMLMEYPGRIMEISSDGKLLWEHKTPSLAVMFGLLPNGNVFYPHGAPSPGAEEVDRSHAVVWSYTSTAGELLGGERLANGNTLLGEGGPAIALELNPAKQVVRSIAVPTSYPTAHGQVRRIRRLDNGNVLAALEGEGAVREFNASGATIWEYKGIASAHDALRLPNGNTLIGGGQSKRVLEVTPQGQIAWEFNATDAPSLGLVWICDLQVLKSGNLLVSNWVGANGGTGVHVFEVTRDKRVVYQYDDHTLVKSTTTVVAPDD